MYESDFRFRQLSSKETAGDAYDKEEPEEIVPDNNNSEDIEK